MTREIEARLKISAVDRTGAALKSVSGKLDQVNRRAAALNRQQGVLARTSQASFAAMARFAAPAVLAYGAKQAVTEFAAVERQMTRIGITADASAKDVEAAFSTLQAETKKLALPVEQGIAALDTMVASGMSLQEAMAFLPSVLATAQATGAATEDIANTGLKAASALKIEAREMQRAFDIMVTGGKAGQFELKDMAQYIPGLANSFATLGYEGEDGLKRLVAILQTIREDTGDASSAATQAQNIFGKIYSEETGNKFKKMGVDLRSELAQARKAGEDTLTAFVRISKEAIDGDLSKLPLLFSDQEFRLGMQSLITSEESLRKFLETMNSAEVDGTVFRDVNKIMTDTQSTIDRLSGSWNKLTNSIGRGIATSGGVEAMDAISNTIDYHSAVNAGLEKRGIKGFWERTRWGVTSSQEEKDQAAVEGGYSDPEFLKNRRGQQYIDEKTKPSVGRQGRKVVISEFPGSSGKGIPVPSARPSAFPDMPRQLDGVPAALRPAPTVASMGQVPSDMKGFFSVPSKAEFQEALRIDATGLRQSGDEAGQKVAEGGRQAGQEIESSAAFLKVAGVDVGAAIVSAAEKLHAAATRLGNMQLAVGAATAGSKPSGVNADTGKTMPPSAGKPAGSAGGW
ncbi:phage tail tape measure protein [Pseudorhizobium pelagicum]|uniref:phage tail tape measure protein n=1 Tax=Pseudorhizobium pelagicum TaxID=1509405 RepID=UPI00068E1EAF|nr:phage tail tape measure protein [Pseudorhizobium pelagicum]